MIDLYVSLAPSTLKMELTYSFAVSLTLTERGFPSVSSTPRDPEHTVSSR